MSRNSFKVFWIISMICVHEVHLMILNSKEHQARLLSIKKPTHHKSQQKSHKRSHSTRKMQKHKRGGEKRMSKLHVKEKHASTSHKSKVKKKHRQLSLPYMDYASSLSNISRGSDFTFSNSLVTMLFIFIMVSMLGRTTKNRRRRVRKLKSDGDALNLSSVLGGAGGADLLSALMGGGNVEGIIKGEKKKFMKYLKKNNVELNRDTPWKQISSVAKRYCKKTYGVDTETFNQFKPMFKKFYDNAVVKSKAEQVDKTDKVEKAAIPEKAAEEKVTPKKSRKLKHPIKKLKSHKNKDSRKDQEKKSKKKSHKKVTRDEEDD